MISKNVCGREGYRRFPCTDKARKTVRIVGIGLKLAVLYCRIAYNPTGLKLVNAISPVAALTNALTLGESMEYALT